MAPPLGLLEWEVLEWEALLGGDGAMRSRHNRTHHAVQARHVAVRQARGEFARDRHPFLQECEDRLGGGDEDVRLCLREAVVRENGASGWVRMSA